MKVFLDTVGCRLNQAEIETVAGQLRAVGHEIVATADHADLAIVNTCAVTARAASDSRAAVRRISSRGAARIAVTGCWATLEPAAAASLPNVQTVVSNDRKEELVTSILYRPHADFDLEPLARQPLPGVHHRTRAFIKVQDGCDNHCTFCITRIARGPARSRPLAAVLSDVHRAVAGRTQEIALTGVQLGSWGQDFGSHLADLVRAILWDTDVPRLRMSSVEPWDLTDEFFSLWEQPRLCPHLHLPLQSGSAATLRRMARKVTPTSFRAVVAAARRVRPDIAITTDVIAGFPGETDDEFHESLAYVESIGFAGGHGFTFSPRPGTAAARMPGHVPTSVRQQRNEAYRSLFTEGSLGYRRRFLGRTEDVLWESEIAAAGGGFHLEGLTANYIRVSADSPVPRWNSIDPVELTELTADGLYGVIRKTG